MYRVKSFLTKKVLYSNGKKIGNIADVVVNFNQKRVEGFSITGGSIFRRKNKIVYIEDIIYYDRSIIAQKVMEKGLLTFSKVKGMEVVDIYGNIIGIAEDILFDSKFNIKGFVISPGLIRKIMVGKRILLMNELIFGDYDILYYGKNKFRFFSLRHSINGIDYYE